jgi:hypothetical protein
MDDIWQKAVKNIRKRKERLAAITATTTAPTYTKPTTSTLMEDDMNTVEKVDMQLACMEQNLAKTRSSPFPERARNAIVKLRASLEELDTETISPSQPTDPAVDVHHISTTTSLPTPANTATTTTTTTTTSTPAASVSTAPGLEQRSTKLPDNEVNERRTEGEEDERQQRREEKGKRVEKEAGTSERARRSEYRGARGDQREPRRGRR